MDDNVKKIGAGVLGVIALVLVVKLLFFSGESKYDIESEDPKERMAAIEDYRRRDSSSSRQMLIRVAESDTNEQVKLTSIYAMRVNQDKDTERTLRTMSLQQSNPPAVRAESLAALGNYDSVPTTEFTSVLRGNRDAVMRMGAAKGLARRADRSSIPALYDALLDPDEKVRAWAITGIKNIAKAGFVYDPKKSPNEQRAVIQHIGSYLRRNGFL